MPEGTRFDFSGTLRFELVRVLGTGGMGVVYEALDRERDGRVALKTLRTLDAEALARFKNEFRSLQDIQHPNLVSLGELMEENGQLFFTMELVRGVDFFEWVRPREAGDERGSGSIHPSRRAPDDDITAGPSSTVQPRRHTDAPKRRGGATFDEARLRSALGQLAGGLHALHSAQKVHRDIKPSNVLVNDRGRVVILDFGLVIDAHGAGESSSVVGTAHFMAPEQAAARPVGPEADWYSMGVMLYLALTGSYPFQLASEVALDLKQRVEPPRPGLMVDGIPQDLEELCVALLRRDAAARPTGREVLERLHVTAVDTPAAILGSDFVGRRRELEELARAFADARRGSAVTLLLEGESGVGKSALMRHFLDHGAEGAAIFAGRCYERESVPYKAVDELIDALSRHLAGLVPDVAEALLPPDMSLLAAAFPVLRRIPAVARAAQPEHGAIDPLELRSLVFTTLRELLRRLARRAPLVLAVDDLQWADADSLALLAEAIRPPDAPGLLLLGTLRRSAGPSPEGDPGAALRAPADTSDTPITSRAGDESTRGARLLHAAELRRVVIRSLPPDEAEELAAVLLRDAEGAGGINAAAIAQEAGGHPLFIDALVRHRLVHGQDSGPLRLDDVISARIARVDPAAQQLLELIAVAGGPLHRDAAAHAAAIDPGEITRMIALLRAAHLARTTGAGRDEVLEPFHDRVRETVVTRLDPDKKTALHARIAAALEASGRIDPEALAGHWQDAGDLARAADYAARAADQANAALAFDRAARLYRMAIELDPKEGAEGRALLTRLGDALGNAGRGSEAAVAYLGAIYQASPVEALELERRAAENLLRSGYVDEGMAGLRSVMSAFGMDLQRSARHALASLLEHRDAIDQRGLEFVERPISALKPEALTEIDICWSAALGLAMVDPIRGADFQARNLFLSLEAGEPYRIARALALEAAFVAASSGRARQRAAALLEASARVAPRAKHPHALGLGLAVNGVLGFLDGRFRHSLDALDRAEVVLRERCAGVPWERGSVLTFGAWDLWFLGDLRELVRRTSLYLREAEDRGDRYLATNLRSGFTNACWLAQGDPAAARREAADAIRRWSKSGFHLQHLFDVVAQAQIDLYEGNGAAAHARVSGAWASLEASLALHVEVIRIAAHHIRARAALAAASERGPDQEARLHEAQRSARRIELERAAWARPLAKLVRAGVAATRGDGARAEELAREAAAGFDAAEMALFAAASRLRWGEVTGGAAGREVAEASARWMEAQGVRNVPRMAAMLAPGFCDWAHGSPAPHRG